MASVFARGGKLWGKVKDETGKWVNKPLDLPVGDEKRARRVVELMQAKLDAMRGGDSAPAGPLTVEAYAKTWIADRRERGIGSVDDDEARLARHVLPTLGQIRLDAVRTKHVRDLVRDLVKADTLAPRTVRNVYRVLHVMFHEAVVEERIDKNPCVLKKGDLPKNIDKDPEWRAAATFTTAEVEQLISDERILPDRRVVYALKAIAGLRHGEVAALRWRHYDATLEPLGRLLVAAAYDSKAGEEKATKTEVTRRVPTHPTLAKVLAAWKLSGWEATFGRAPTADDYIVPTRTLAPRDKKDARDGFMRDLAALELRIKAGAERNRGGHDLRSWFITTCQEHGAHRDLLRVVTHTSVGDVFSGYTRASWPALCGEVGKLRVSLLDGKVLELGTSLGTARPTRRNRWAEKTNPPVTMTGGPIVRGAVRRTASR